MPQNQDAEDDSDGFCLRDLFLHDRITVKINFG